MRYPDFLKDNGRIGFIAPSFGCVIEPYNSLFKQTIDIFGQEGYELNLGPNCFISEGVGKSNTAVKCAAEINDFFINDKSDVIISCGGGETMCEDLEYVAFDKIRQAKAKWYVGYSDNTNMTFTLNTLCDTASIYGPCAASYSLLKAEKYNKNVKDSWELIKGKLLKFHNYEEWLLEPGACGIGIEEGCREIIAAEDNAWDLPVKAGEHLSVEWINDKPLIVMDYNQQIFEGSIKSEKAEFSGRLIGGCLDCLGNLVGTPYDKVVEFAERYKDDGFIWFLEACDLNAMSIRRSLWQLKSAGWFKYVKGFLIGRPLHYNDNFVGSGHIDSVIDILGDMNVPIVLDIDLGHLSPAMPIISGAMGKVNARGNEFEIEYELI